MTKPPFALIPAALLLVCPMVRTAEADPVVVITWNGTVDSQCFDRTLCRGVNPWTNAREWQVSVDGVDQNPAGTLAVEVRPDAIRPRCGGFTNFGAIHVTCGTYPTEHWAGQYANFNNENYTGAGGVYTSAIQCNRYGSFYGAGPDGDVWWWLSADGSHGTIVLGAAGLGDANRDGQVSVGDLFAFCDRYFAGDREADMDGSATVNVSDVWAFLAAYFGG